MRSIGLVVLVGLCAALIACGGDSDDGGDEPLPTAVRTVGATAQSGSDDPVGIIAIGDSSLTGNNADPARSGEDTKEYSWATGTVPEINSIYQRMIASRPEAEGSVYNAAKGGTAADALVDQATEALAEVPSPEIVILLTMGNDIRCDGTDADHVAEFGEGISEALQVITDASPKSKILVPGFFGRPTPEDVNAIIERAPELKTVVTGTGPCDWYDPSGAIAPQSFETFYEIIDAYEAEQARVCAEVPQCSTDGGAAASFEDSPDDYSDDYTHLSANGLARFAEHMWPTVQELLAEQ